MNQYTLDALLNHLFSLRSNPVNVLISYGRVDGYLDALRDTQVINSSEWHLLFKLFNSAFEFSGFPFPDKSNVGPVMPLFISRKCEEASL